MNRIISYYIFNYITWYELVKFFLQVPSIEPETILLSKNLLREYTYTGKIISLRNFYCCISNINIQDDIMT